MNRQFFNQQFAALVSAYTIARKLSDEAQDVYWEMLKDIPHEKFAHGVKNCLATCKFFPTIAELGEASLPPVRDYKAPLPPVDKPFTTLNWREQIQRHKHKAIEQRWQTAIDDIRNEKGETYRRVFIPGPDRRNVKRGVEWLRKMIEASEQKENMDKVIEQMVTPDRERET